MGLLGPVAQFGDIAQHQHLAPVETLETSPMAAQTEDWLALSVINHTHAVAGQLRGGRP